MPESWLRRDGEVIVEAEIAHGRRARRRGLLGRDGLAGVLVLPYTRQVHTVGMRFPIDVVWCDVDGSVLRVATLQPNRLGAWVWRAHTVLEAEGGSVERWGIAVGDRLTWNE